MLIQIIIGIIACLAFSLGIGVIISQSKKKMTLLLVGLFLVGVSQAQDPADSVVTYPVIMPSYTIQAEGDTVWIGQEGFIETDSTVFDSYAWGYWYPIFSTYSDSYAFKVVKDLAVLVEFADNTRPTNTDLNNYPYYVCMKLSQGYKVRVNWKELNIYNAE